MAQKRRSRILVGTASWSDPGFVERWYPKKMPAHERLGWYAQHFEMVEVNSTFYSVPDVRTVERWCAATPEPFVFDVKLHQLFSFHSTAAKLLPPELQRIASADAKGKVNASATLRDALLKIFLDRVSILNRHGKLGVLLLQLSPAFSPRKHQLTELEPLIQQLSDYRLAIELRNRNWLVDKQFQPTLDFFEKQGVGFVNVDAPRAEHFSIIPPDLNAITNSRFGYLRLHGRNERAYLTGKTVAARFDYDYSDKEIEEVRDRTEDLAKEASEMHVVFNNNNLDYAPRAAIRLRRALGQATAAPPPQTPELF